MNNDIDRNLLHGLLALQTRLVDRESLCAAVRSWAACPEKTLAETLLAQGQIEQDDFSLIQTLANKRLRAHDDDVRRALESFDDLAEARAELERLVNEAAAARQSHAPDADAYRTVAPVDQNAAWHSRFRIVRPLAKGGLGQVFVAHDDEVNREVALKEIQAQYAFDENSRARFLLEAEVTGGLEHPGIVPVYGMGKYPDNRPYYAMRFIRGESLATAIEDFHRQAPEMSPGDRDLRLRQLLNRFIDVCDAIEYAHSRGVLHRDLKPDNIMLGKYGETLVVDWGLAKISERPDLVAAQEERPLKPVSGSGSLPTQFGAVVGTPQYMSPEQATGDLDRVGPAGDVYSLGATLYTILTGQPPVPMGETWQALQKVTRGDIRPPHEINRLAPRPLEAICMKAMALDPAARYPSARALATDIERWLSDEPVSAFNETLRERIGRWTRKHRSGTQAIALTLIAVTLVSTVAMFVINRARQNEVIAKQQAMNNFRLAREAVDSLLTGVSDELEYVPGAQALRMRLLRQAAVTFEQFVQERSRDPELQYEAGQSFLRLAEVHRSLGDLQHARQDLNSAVELFSALAQRERGAVEYQLAIAKGRTEAGRVESDLQNHVEAESLHRSAIAVLDEIVARDKFDREALAARGVAYINLGVVYVDVGRFGDAEHAFEQAIDDLRRVVESGGDKETHATRVHDLARAYINLGFVLARDATAADRVEQAYQSAIARSQELVQSHPEVPKYQQLLANARLNLGGFYFETRNDPAKALEVYRESVRFYQSLTARFPRTPEYLAGLANSQIALGNALSESGSDQAEEAYQQAIADTAALLRLNDYLPRFHYIAAKAHYQLGSYLLSMERYAAAIKPLEAAIEHATISLKPEADVREYRELLRDAREAQVAALLESGQIEKALDEMPRYRESWTGERTSDYLYLGATFLARGANLAFDGDNDSTARRAASEAIEYLKSAIDAGFNDCESLKANDEIGKLRARESFKKDLDELFKKLNCG